MKRIHLCFVACIFCLATSTSLLAQPIINIPDANFKANLLSNGSINSNFDSDIDSAEAASYASLLNVSSLGITDLTGIEAFTSITSFNAAYNNITTADMSSNVALTDLRLDYNLITNVDLSNLSNITYLKLDNNSLTTVDLSQLTSLYSLDIGYNLLTSMDLSNNTGLEYLYCDSNYLTTLDISNNGLLNTLYCRENLLTGLNTWNNTNLATIYCGENPFTCVDVSSCWLLTFFECSNAPNLQKLNLKQGFNTILTVSVSACPNLGCVQVDDSLYSETNWTGFPASSYFMNDCGAPNASFTHNAPVCEGTPINFDQTISNADWFKWEFGDGDTSTMVDPSHLYVNAGHYTVYLNAGNCYGTVYPSADIDMGYPIQGAINYSGGPLGDGNIYLLKYQPFYTSYDTVGILNGFETAGFYWFGNVFDGQYVVNVHPDTSINPNLITTYSGDEPSWETAFVINQSCVAATTHDITMLEIVATTPGTGSISGEVIEGAGFGRAQGDPVHGVDVKLGLTSSSIIAMTQTDTMGNYTFTGVPNGTYTIFVEIPGLLKDSSYTVTIDSAMNTWTYLDYIVDSVSIYITGNIGIEEEADANPNTLDVYPNPVRGNAMIKYSIVEESDVQIELFNMYGSKMGSLLNTHIDAGEYIMSFSPQSMGLKSGIYFITTTINGRSQTKRIVVLE